jgi:hypothetical protein
LKPMARFLSLDASLAMRRMDVGATTAESSEYHVSPGLEAGGLKIEGDKQAPKIPGIAENTESDSFVGKLTS